MKFVISGKNIEVTDGLKTAVQDKLGKLERYFTPDNRGPCNPERGKRETENRGDHSREGQHYPV